MELAACAQVNSVLRRQSCAILLTRHHLFEKGRHQTAIHFDGTKPHLYLLMLLGSESIIIPYEEDIEIICHTPTLLLEAFFSEACVFLQSHRVTSFLLHYPQGEPNYLATERRSSALLAVISSLGPCCESIDISPSAAATTVLSEGHTHVPYHLPGSTINMNLKGVELSLQNVESVAYPLAMFGEDEIFRRYAPLLLCPSARQLNLLQTQSINSASLQRFFRSVMAPQLKSLRILSQSSGSIILPDNFSHFHPSVESLELLHVRAYQLLPSIFSNSTLRPTLSLPSSIREVAVSPNYRGWTIKTSMSNLQSLTIHSFFALPSDEIYCQLLRSVITTIIGADTQLIRPDFCLIINCPLGLMTHIMLRLKLEEGHSDQGRPACECLTAPTSQSLRILRGFKFLKLQDLFVKTLQTKEFTVSRQPNFC